MVELFTTMQIDDKVIWSNHYGYEVGWLTGKDDSEASFKLISGTRKGARVSKPIEQVERFSEELYQELAEKFGEKFGGSESNM